jgi:hypothetical protein
MPSLTRKKRSSKKKKNPKKDRKKKKGSDKAKKGHRHPSTSRRSHHSPSNSDPSSSETSSSDSGSSSDSNSSNSLWGCRARHHRTRHTPRRNRADSRYYNGTDPWVGDKTWIYGLKAGGMEIDTEASPRRDLRQKDVTELFNAAADITAIRYVTEKLV